MNEEENGVQFPTTAAADALDVLDTFRSLGKTERERVQGFVCDAAVRQNEPAKEAVYSALEVFAGVVASYESGATPDATCADFGISDVRYFKYRAAWRTVKRLKEEAETAAAACFVRGEPEGEPPR